MRQWEASDALRERGYRYASDQGRRDASWWNERDRQCVIVISNRGRVSDVVAAKPGDCGQKDKKDNTGKIVAGALIAGAVVAVAAASAEDARRKEEAERRGEYSPAKGVTCWRRERVCNDSRGRSEAWTQYEFPAPASSSPRR
ncbi:YcgJ family protein [Caulobacter rhizosphaerae]|uniref:YcgJ family protein n=1 Tax=Caulobacter rhizosphaerae TaxID=2010972 RepID=UPI0013D085BD|nr:YcgJ family protein [Caulobacter rhizosphaerae]